jgi:hypothetical protein
MRLFLILIASLGTLAAQPSPKLKERIPASRAEAVAFVADARYVLLPVEVRLLDEGLNSLKLLLGRSPNALGPTAKDIWDWLPGKTLEYAIMIGRSDRRAQQQRAINATYEDLEALKAQAAAATDLDLKARLLAQSVRTRETLRILVADRDRPDPEVAAYYAQIRASQPMPTPPPAVSQHSSVIQPSPKLAELIPTGRAEAAAFVADASNFLLPVEARILDDALRAMEVAFAQNPRPSGLTGNDIWDWLQGRTLDSAIIYGISDRWSRQQQAVKETRENLEALKAQAAAATDLDLKARLLAQAVRTRETLRILVADRDRPDPEVSAYYTEIRARQYRARQSAPQPSDP